MERGINNSETWYEQTASRGAGGEALSGHQSTDVCIVGGGLAGVTLALELARAGVQVCLLEKHKIAWAASGRNGGFVSSGFAEEIGNIAKAVGKDAARKLFELSRQGVEYVRRHATAMPDVIEGNGMLVVQRHPDSTGALREYAHSLARDYGESSHYLSKAETRLLLQSPRYHAAIMKDEAFHIHPLAYALGIAHSAVTAGVRLHENTEVASVTKQGTKWRVASAQGLVNAEHVVFCVSALDQRLHPVTARAILPVATYVAVTTPVPDQDAIRTRSCIVDTRRASDYYRLLQGGRVLWGGRITTSVTEPQRLAQAMRGDMLSVYPQLAGAAVESCWAGIMGYARHKMPLIGRDAEGLWYATAFGGHGLNTTAMAAQLLARAIAAGDDEYRRFAAFQPRWAGGPFGRIAVQLSYWAMQAKDRRAEKNPL